MSYNIRLQVTDGTVTVAATGGTVPDGAFELSGHEDPGYATISVLRTVGGTAVSQASAASYAAQFAGVTS